MTGPKILSPGVSPLHRSDPGRFESLVRKWRGGRKKKSQMMLGNVRSVTDLHWLEGLKYEDWERCTLVDWGAFPSVSGEMP